MVACFSVVGIDTAHMSTVKLGRITEEKIHEICGLVVPPGGAYMLEKLVVTMVTGRTFNNEMIIFAFCIGYTENSADMFHFFQFLVDCGLPINRPEMTILTDRGQAYVTPISLHFPEALHFLCPLHLQRNLSQHVPGAMAGGNSSIIHHFWRMQRARSKEEFERCRNALIKVGAKGLKAVAYLDNIKGDWQLYKVDHRRNVLYDMKSSNIVEGAFAWGLDARAYGSAYGWLFWF